MYVSTECDLTVGQQDQHQWHVNTTIIYAQMPWQTGSMWPLNIMYFA